MRVTPSIPSTKYGNDSYEWIPCCFDSFLKELYHVKEVCGSIDHLAIYRGHRDSRWLLDSTFIRHVKENILGVSAISRVRPDYRNSLEFHRMLGCLFLYKFNSSFFLIIFLTFCILKFSIIAQEDREHSPNPLEYHIEFYTTFHLWYFDDIAVMLYYLHLQKFHRV